MVHHQYNVLGMAVFYLQYNTPAIQHKDVSVTASKQQADHPSSEPLSLMSKGVDAHMLVNAPIKLLQKRSKDLYLIDEDSSKAS